MPVGGSLEILRKSRTRRCRALVDIRGRRAAMEDERVAHPDGGKAALRQATLAEDGQ
jgi:hypothetical protein